MREITAAKNLKHGMYGTSTHRTWSSMVARCRYKNEPSAKNYVGRGIEVCERWQSFDNFYADMGDRPRGTTLDRWPNNNGNYEPGNCRWATKSEQARNTRVNHLISFGGETLTMIDWAERTGIKYKKLAKRLYSGWDLEKALTP